MKDNHRKTALIILRIVALLFFVVSMALHIDVMVPDAKQSNDPKPNLEKDLKPLKKNIAHAFMFGGSVLLLLTFSFRNRKPG